MVNQGFGMKHPIVVVTTPRPPIALLHLQILVTLREMLKQRLRGQERVIASRARLFYALLSFDLARGENCLGVVAGVNVALQ